MDWQVLFNIAGGSFFWYLVVKRLYGHRIAELARKYLLIQSVPEWTEVDEFYHSRFVEHVNYCQECDPQDTPCEIGQQMLDDWKVAKEREE